VQVLLQGKEVLKSLPDGCFALWSPEDHPLLLLLTIQTTHLGIFENGQCGVLLPGLTPVFSLDAPYEGNDHRYGL
jgi:hypothetical protein